MRFRNKDSRNTGSHKRKLIMISKMEMWFSLLKKKSSKTMTSNRKKKKLARKKRFQPLRNKMKNKKIDSKKIYSTQMIIN